MALISPTTTFRTTGSLPSTSTTTTSTALPPSSSFKVAASTSTTSTPSYSLPPSSDFKTGGDIGSYASATSPTATDAGAPVTTMYGSGGAVFNTTTPPVAVGDTCSAYWANRRMVAYVAGGAPGQVDYGDRVATLITRLNLEPDQQVRMDSLKELSRYMADGRAQKAITRAAYDGDALIRATAQSMHPQTDNRVLSKKVDWKKLALMGGAVIAGVAVLRMLAK